MVGAGGNVLIGSERGRKGKCRGQEEGDGMWRDGRDYVVEDKIERTRRA